MTLHCVSLTHLCPAEVFIAYVLCVFLCLLCSFRSPRFIRPIWPQHFASASLLGVNSPFEPLPAPLIEHAMAGGLRFCSEVPLRFDDSAVNESEAVWDDAGERAAQREERPFFQVLRRDR